MSRPKRAGVFGATGYTGQLVVAELVGAGCDVVAAGRNPEKLEELARRYGSAAQTCVADVEDVESLRTLVEKCDVLCSTVGPFSQLGRPVVEACVRAGVSYLDTTGEQFWVDHVASEFDRKARERGVTLCPAMAFEIAVADCATELAAGGRTDVREVTIVYALRHWSASSGTLRSAVDGLSRVGWYQTPGRRQREAPGLSVRAGKLPPPFERRALASFPSPESITVPRRHPSAAVRVYMALPSWLRSPAKWFGPRLPSMLRGRRGQQVATMLGGRRGGGPEPKERAKALSLVAAEVRCLSGEVRTARVELRDLYQSSAQIAAFGVQRMLAGNTGAGFQGPAQVVGDPRSLMDVLGRQSAALSVHDGSTIFG